MRFKMYKSVQGLCLRIRVDAVPMFFHSLSAAQPSTFKSGSRIQAVALHFSFHWNLTFFIDILHHLVFLT